MEQFVAQIDLPALATLLNGRFSHSEYRLDVDMPIERATATPGSASGSTTANFVHSLGIPNNHLTDGPAGLHIPNNEIGCTAFPVGVLLAQTWDMPLIEEIGQTFGKELLDHQMTVLLAPGMNIHRDPLFGRSFEYFSEDPRLTGLAATKFTLGVQSHPGIGVSVKHFVANNQETFRGGGNSSVSERALREIYLKGFEMAVKSAQPMTVMTSYNQINGTQTSSSVDLCTHILRGEWGFKGYVMTEWFTASDSGLDMHAGNDIIMGGWHTGRLINAVLAQEPVFNDDGSIHSILISLFGGLKQENIAAWNAFIPDAEGKDTCATTIAANIDVSNKVMELVENNIASVIQHNDGTKTVTYRGVRKEAYTALGDLQHSAINVLYGFLRSWTVQNVYNSETGYEPIDVKPYNLLFDHLQTYLTIEKSAVNEQFWGQEN
jgi:beta-glucosidase